VSFPHNLTGKSVFITGAAGFIGSHLVETLIQQGCRVTALVHYNAHQFMGNLAYVPPDLLAKVRVEFGDICDPEQMKALVADHEVIIHAAALIGIPYSYAAPRSYVRTNSEGTMNMLEAARFHAVRRFVFMSTSEVYGSARQIPIAETHPLQAQSPYSATKIAAEALVEAWSRNFSVPTVIVRPFNTYGPRQSQRAIIPTIIRQALQGQSLRLGSLTPIRDFCFVSDTVAGLITAAFHPGLGPGPYNLGTGRGVSIAQLIDIISGLVGHPLTIEQDEQRLRPEAGEVDRLIADNSLFHSASGWQPLVSLEQGLTHTINFIAAHSRSNDIIQYTV